MWEEVCWTYSNVKDQFSPSVSAESVALTFVSPHCLVAMGDMGVRCPTFLSSIPFISKCCTAFVFLLSEMRCLALSCRGEKPSPAPGHKRLGVSSTFEYAETVGAGLNLARSESVCRTVLLPGYASIIPGGRCWALQIQGAQLIFSVSRGVGVEGTDVHLAAHEYSRTC